VIEGKLALGGLSLEFGGSQKRFDELSAKVEELAERHEQLLDEQGALFEELARVYLPELTPESVSAGLRQLQAHLRDALVEQRQHRVAVAQRLGEAEVRVAELQAEVVALAENEAEAGTRLAEATVAVKAALGDDTGHGGLASEHEAVMERRAALKHRRARLQGTANAERQNYEAFKPFAYLQGRQFGEPEYHAGSITRALDRWLARRIDYDLLAERYRILKIGPHAIQAEI
jgi:predicted  nucleic acid-binding Zn-ribbon protein